MSPVAFPSLSLQCSVSLSVICPKQLPKLKSIYNAVRFGSAYYLFVLSIKEKYYLFVLLLSLVKTVPIAQCELIFILQITFLSFVQHWVRSRTMIIKF